MCGRREGRRGQASAPRPMQCSVNNYAMLYAVPTSMPTCPRLCCVGGYCFPAYLTCNVQTANLSACPFFGPCLNYSSRSPPNCIPMVFRPLLVCGHTPGCAYALQYIRLQCRAYARLPSRCRTAASILMPSIQAMSLAPTSPTASQLQCLLP